MGTDTQNPPEIRGCHFTSHPKRTDDSSKYISLICKLSNTMLLSTHIIIMWSLAIEWVLSYATRQCVGMLLTFCIFQVIFDVWKYFWWPMVAMSLHERTWASWPGYWRWTHNLYDYIVVDDNVNMAVWQVKYLLNFHAEWWPITCLWRKVED